MEIVEYDENSGVPARLNGRYIRDETGQAAYLGEMLEIFHAESHVSIRERAGCLRAGQTMQLLEAQVVKVDGRLVDVEVAGTRLEDPAENLIQLIVRDI